ncbi:MAG: aldo/keto reductase [Chitinivibrionales bacterium]|nr:aldo/keto reductase [Chitinivibrionales bacterium]MBD3394157.1 aldo/keto reductase [Chitinivibrionales bacterium]
MKYNTVGRTGIRISEIGLGCWTIGGPNWKDGRPDGWAAVDEGEAVSAIRYALDNGVNHFDTADVYGNGHAERVLADGLGERTRDVVIASKVGHFRGTARHAYEPAHIRHQCEQSLINLRREHIDIYYFHHGDFGVNDCYLDDAAATMMRLVDEGKVRAVGLSAYTERDFKRLVSRIRPAVLQSWAHAADYHFIARRSAVMRLCEEYGMSFIAFSPLARGLLLDRYRSAHPPQFPEGDHRRASPQFSAENIARVERALTDIKARFGASTGDLARVALQFVLYHDHVAGVIPGFRSREQVRTNLAATQRPLDGREVARVRKAFAPRGGSREAERAPMAQARDAM